MTKQSGVPGSNRALEPSNDTARIAAALSVPSISPSDEVLRVAVEATIHQWALRFRYVPQELLYDPAWAMLLELFHAELGKRPVTASILCKAARVPASIGERWIAALISKDLCTPIDGAGEADGTLMQLSEQGGRAMRGYFAYLAATE